MALARTRAPRVAAVTTAGPLLVLGASGSPAGSGVRLTTPAARVAAARLPLAFARTSGGDAAHGAGYGVYVGPRGASLLLSRGHKRAPASLGLHLVGGTARGPRP